MFWPLSLSPLGQDTLEPRFLAHDADRLSLPRRELVLANGTPVTVSAVPLLTSPTPSAQQVLPRNCLGVCFTPCAGAGVHFRMCCTFRTFLGFGSSSATLQGPVPARLPGSSRPSVVVFSACVCVLHLPGPALQYRLSPALVSWIFTWLLALYCVLGVFVVTVRALFGGSSAPPWGELPRSPRKTLRGAAHWLWGSSSGRLAHHGQCWAELCAALWLEEHFPHENPRNFPPTHPTTHPVHFQIYL